MCKFFFAGSNFWTQYNKNFYLTHAHCTPMWIIVLQSRRFLRSTGLGPKDGAGQPGRSRGRGWSPPPPGSTRPGSCRPIRTNHLQSGQHVHSLVDQPVPNTNHLQPGQRVQALVDQPVPTTPANQANHPPLSTLLEKRLNVVGKPRNYKN